MPFFMDFCHPVYQVREYRELAYQVIYLLEVESVLDQNVNFRSSYLDHNHQGIYFCLEGEFKQQNGSSWKKCISNDVWRCISRNVDQIKGICEPTTDSLGVSQEKSYRNIDLYNEIVSFHAILRQPNLFSEKQSCDVIKNLYEKYCHQI